MRASYGTVGAVLIGITVLGGDLSQALAQQGKGPKPDKGSIETRAQAAATKVGGAEPQNMKEAQIQTRQGPDACDIRFVNTTDWYIHRVYVDRRRIGSLGRRSSGLYPDEADGRTTLYAEADFVDGSVRSWGPHTFMCEPWSTYTWRLRE